MITQLYVYNNGELQELKAPSIVEEVQTIGTDLKKSFYVGYDGSNKLWSVSKGVPHLAID